MFTFGLLTNSLAQTKTKTINKQSITHGMMLICFAINVIAPQLIPKPVTLYFRDYNQYQSSQKRRAFFTKAKMCIFENK